MENVNVEEEVTVVDTADGVEEQQKSQINIKCILLVALASVALAFHVVCIILYLLGAVQFYGQPLHLINAVKLFLDLFSTMLCDSLSHSIGRGRVRAVFCISRVWNQVFGFID